MASDVKTYRGRTLEEILPQVREELGPEAVVLRRREGLAGGIGGFFQRRFVEIEARGPQAGDHDLGVRNDRASAEGLASPAVRALVEQAQPFADALARAESGVAARAEAVLAAAAQGAAVSAGASPAAAGSAAPGGAPPSVQAVPDLLGALRAAPPERALPAPEKAGPAREADDAPDPDPGLYGPQPRRFVPARDLTPARPSEADAPTVASPPTGSDAPARPEAHDAAAREAVDAAADGEACEAAAPDVARETAEPPTSTPAPAPEAATEGVAAEGPARSPSPDLEPSLSAGESSLADRTSSLAEHLLAAIAASRGLAEEEAAKASGTNADPAADAPEPLPADAKEPFPADPRNPLPADAKEPFPAEPTEPFPADAPEPDPVSPVADAPEPRPAEPPPAAPPALAPAPPAPVARHTVPDRLVPAGADALEGRLVGAGLSPELAGEVVAEGVAHGMPFAAPGELEAVVRLALSRRIPAMGPIGTGARVLAVIGAGGAGKSAMAGHLAAAYADAGARVVLVALRSADGGRALAARLEPLGVTVIAARDAAQADERLAGSPPPLLTLLDTPAVSPADTAGLAALGADLRALRATEVHLALPATVSIPAAQESLATFAALAPSHVALTHADETQRPGAPVELAIRAGWALSYLCTRDALAPVDPLALAERLLP